jgi:hypothetical protein
MVDRRKLWTLGGAATGAAAVLAALKRRSTSGDAGATPPRPPGQISLDEAKRIRSERLAEMKALSYDDLARYCDVKLACEVLGRDGVKYAHETDTFYDDGRGGPIRVLVEVWAYDPSAQQWTDKLAGGGLWVEPGSKPPDEWFDEEQP